MFDRECTPASRYDFYLPQLTRVSSMGSEFGRSIRSASEQPMSVLSLCDSEGVGHRDKKDFIKLFATNFARAVVEAVESKECQDSCYNKTKEILNGAPLPPVTVSAGVAVFNRESSNGKLTRILNDADS